MEVKSPVQSVPSFQGNCTVWPETSRIASRQKFGIRAAARAALSECGESQWRRPRQRMSWPFPGGPLAQRLPGWGVLAE